jgi:hypothetical protein
MSVDELVRELLKLQIRQTELLGLLLDASQATVGEVETPTGPQVVQPDSDPDRPLQVGDQVKILNPSGLRVRKDTVCVIIRIGKRITSVTPTGVKIVRSAHNLERV